MSLLGILLCAFAGYFSQRSGGGGRALFAVLLGEVGMMLISWH